MAGETEITGPVRRCAGCGKKAGKPEFVRVVRLPDGNVVFDPAKKLEGRSLYFCPTRKCFELIMKRKAPDKLLKTIIPDPVREEIQSHLSLAERET